MDILIIGVVGLAFVSALVYSIRKARKNECVGCSKCPGGENSSGGCVCNVQGADGESKE